MLKSIRIICGILAWSTGLGILIVWLHRHVSEPDREGSHIVESLWEFASADRRLVTFQFDGVWLVSIGDPIYQIDRTGSIEQVGEIRRLRSEDSWSDAKSTMSSGAEVLLYPNAPDIRAGLEAIYYTTPRSLTWVMETMLPQEKRILIAREIIRTYETYHTEILQALKPVLIGGLLDTLRIVEQDFARAVSSRRAELEALANHYQNHVLEQEILPLVRDEIWPIVQHHAEPLANQVGQEMFEQMSLWRFGWRFLYDKSPFPRKDLARAEWNRFVNKEGIPILNRHKADLVAVQKKIIEEITANDRVRETIQQNLTRIIDDPEFRSIFWELFREVLVNNPRLRQTLEARWSGPEARRAMQLAAYYTEPCVRQIGDLLFGTRKDGIAPEFAQVLRNQILDKDCCWFVLESDPDPGPDDRVLGQVSGQPVIPVHLGKNPTLNPFAAQLQEIRP